MLIMLMLIRLIGIIDDHVEADHENGVDADHDIEVGVDADVDVDAAQADRRESFAGSEGSSPATFLGRALVISF